MLEPVQDFIAAGATAAYKQEHIHIAEFFLIARYSPKKQQAARKTVSVHGFWARSAKKILERRVSFCLKRAHDHRRNPHEVNQGRPRRLGTNTAGGAG